MTSIASHRIVRGAAILSTVLVGGVIGCRGKSDRAPGDTGAAAPATVRDMSETPNVPGQPSTPGDTLGARGRDTSKGPRAGSPAGPGGAPPPKSY